MIPHDRTMRLGVIGLVLLLVSVIGGNVQRATADEWSTVGTLKVAPQPYAFLASSPYGDLIATSFNTSTASAQMPMFVIRNPTSADPQVSVVCQIPFSSQRGYSGVTCDSKGYFYVAADTGEPSTSFIRKYRPDGTPEISFGQGGQLLPGRRCLGLDVMGDYLLVALNWGEVGVFRTDSGQPLSSFVMPGGQVYLRDIAIDPGTMRVFGVAAGSVYLWDNGTPWDTQSYHCTRLTVKETPVRAGEGLSLDPFTRRAFTTPIPGNTLQTIGDRGDARFSTVGTATTGSWLADSCLSFDGSTLFVSDLNMKRIHVMRRTAGSAVSESILTAAANQARSGVAPPPEPIPNYIPRTTWYRSYLGVVEGARRHHRPLVLYFRMSTYDKCRQFEQSTLLTPDFDGAIDDSVVCVVEDVSKDPMIAYRLGVLRVPHVELFGSDGRIVATFSYDVERQQLLEMVRGLR